MNKTTTLRNTDHNRATATRSTAARTISGPRFPMGTAPAHPVLVGDRNYLRALRAAEMIAWENSLPLPLAQSFAETVAETTTE